MSTLANRSNTALIVVDVQNAVVAKAYRRDEVVGNIKTLVERARDADVPVVWIRHSDAELIEGSEPWQIVSDLRPSTDEVVIGKHFNDSFEDTDLEQVLAARGVGRLYVTGAQTEWCVRSTLHGAVTRGYDTFLVEDAHTTDESGSAAGALSAEQIIAHTNHYWRWHQAPRRDCGIVGTAELSFA